VHLRVQGSAIPAPIGAKNQDHILVGFRGFSDRRGDLLMRVRFLIIRRLLSGHGYAGQEGKGKETQ
jgi:hypothetical protein